MVERVLWTPEQIARLRELWATNVPIREIGRRLKISHNAVAAKRRRMQLPERGCPIKYVSSAPAPAEPLLRAVKVLATTSPPAPAPAPAPVRVRPLLPPKPVPVQVAAGTLPPLPSELGFIPDDENWRIA